MDQIWERYKPLQLISLINTDHAMFIWRGKLVLSFSKKFIRYQNREILWCLNAIVLSNLCMYIIEKTKTKNVNMVYLKTY